jgi:hypothetical protein
MGEACSGLVELRLHSSYGPVENSSRFVLGQSQIETKNRNRAKARRQRVEGFSDSQAPFLVTHRLRDRRVTEHLRLPKAF